jgi:hypothetical protein
MTTREDIDNMCTYLDLHNLSVEKNPEKNLLHEGLPFIEINYFLCIPSDAHQYGGVPDGGIIPGNGNYMVGEKIKTNVEDSNYVWCLERYKVPRSIFYKGMTIEYVAVRRRPIGNGGNGAPIAVHADGGKRRRKSRKRTNKRRKTKKRRTKTLLP